MNRKYKIDECKNIINQFRNKYPDITISTDIIVGFPSETEKQFQNTIKYIEKIRPDIVNVTRFSNRPHTEAKNMHDKVKTEIMKERSKKLSNICSRISAEKNKELIGKKYSVLITEKGKNNTTVGRTENYKPVVINENIPLGKSVSVVIERATSTYLVGRLI
jgi:tRNA A37 methylthiotransferase MiaB